MIEIILWSTCTHTPCSVQLEGSLTQEPSASICHWPTESSNVQHWGLGPYTLMTTYARILYTLGLSDVNIAISLTKVNHTVESFLKVRHNFNLMNSRLLKLTGFHTVTQEMWFINVWIWVVHPREGESKNSWLQNVYGTTQFYTLSCIHCIKKTQRYIWGFLFSWFKWVNYVSKV